MKLARKDASKSHQEPTEVVNYSKCRSQKLSRALGAWLPIFPFCIFPLPSSSVQSLQFLKLQKSCRSVRVRKESSLLQGVTWPPTPPVKFRAIAHNEHSCTELLQHPQFTLALVHGSFVRYSANVSLLSWQGREEELTLGNGWTRRHLGLSQYSRAQSSSESCCREGETPPCSWNAHEIFEFKIGGFHSEDFS